MDRQLRELIQTLNTIVCNYENKLVDIRRALEYCNDVINNPNSDHESQYYKTAIERVKAFEWVLRLFGEEI